MAALGIDKDSIDKLQKLNNNAEKEKMIKDKKLSGEGFSDISSSDNSDSENSDSKNLNN